MNELTTQNIQLPDTLEDLSKFVLVGREKLNAVRAEIRAIEKVGLAKEVHEQKLLEAQEIAEAVLDAEVKVGELTARIPKNERVRTDLVDTGVAQTKRSQLQKIGIHEKQAERYEQLAKNPEIVEKTKQEARKRGEVVTRSSVLQAINASKPKPPSYDPIKEAKARHEQFQSKKDQKIISFADMADDKRDQKIVAEDLLNQIIDCVSKINQVAAFNKGDVLQLIDPPEWLHGQLQKSIEIIDFIKRRLYER